MQSDTNPDLNIILCINQFNQHYPSSHSILFHSKTSIVTGEQSPLSIGFQCAYPVAL